MTAPADGSMDPSAAIVPCWSAVAIVVGVVENTRDRLHRPIRPVVGPVPREQARRRPLLVVDQLGVDQLGVAGGLGVPVAACLALPGDVPEVIGPCANLGVEISPTNGGDRVL